MSNEKEIFENLAKQHGGKFDKDALMKSLSNEDKQKIKDIMSDKESLAKILKSPEAQAIMKMLKRGDKNG